MKQKLNSVFKYYFRKIKDIGFIFIDYDIKLFLKTNNINYILAKTDSYYSLFIGMYYHFQDQRINNDLVKKFYLLSIELGNHMAMNYLGLYYNTIEKNYCLMEKYYLMSIENGNDMAMNNLGYYYDTCIDDNKKTKKYYRMAIDKGNIDAMYNLGYYYHYKQSKSKQESYIKAIKYYLMAINHGNVKSMYNLGLLYHRYYIDHSNMQQYYLMAIEYGCLKSMNNLGYYYYDIYENYELIKKYFLHIVRKKSTNVNHIYLVPSKKTLGYIKSLYELYEETDYDYL